MPVPRLRSYTGPALLSYGFRPFFLFGSVFAICIILLWLPIWFGEVTLHSSFSPTEWHIHEMLFGYLPAIITGFLFTAVPNWTGRMPLQGKGLLLLLLLWICGRVAVLISSITGWQFALLVDGIFLPVVGMCIFREIMAGQNWRNLKVLIPVLLIAAANILFHFEAAHGVDDKIASRIGFAATIMLIVIIGGRIIPSFTRNWLVRNKPGLLPAPFSHLDLITIGVLAFALASWIVFPKSILTAALLVTGGFAHIARLYRWAGWRTWRDLLVWILHIAYAILCIGIISLGLSIAFPDAVSSASAYHLLGIGGIGTMTLAVMIRASKGHTGQALQAGKAGTLAFFSILSAVVFRIAAEYFPGYYVWMLTISGALWMLAFGAFVFGIGPALLRSRKT